MADTRSDIPTLATASQKQIPLEVLLGNPTRMGLQVSPDGTHLGYVAPVDGVLNVWVGPVDADLSDFRPVTIDTDRGIRQWFWSKGSDRVLYMQDVGGDEDFHLHGVDLASGETIDYTPFEGVRTYPHKMSEKHPDRMIVLLNRDRPELHEPWLLELDGGELTKLAENPGNATSWTATDDLAIRGYNAQDGEGGNILFVRDDDDSEWRRLVHWKMEDAASSYLLGFDIEATTLYAVDSRDLDTAALVSIDPQSGEREILFRDEAYDTTGAINDREAYRPSAAIVQREKLAYEPLDDRYRDDIAAIADLLDVPAEVSVSSRSADDRYWTLYVDTSDRSPACYLYDRSDRSHRFLFAVRPELDDYNLAPMEPFRFTARDGMKVEGYITFPPEAERANLPMVVNVHGGPWTRDGWGYHPEAQWLANRGFICMQVNYRGSTGYGKRFIEAAVREWGGAMHDDLIDAVDWAIEQGYADPDRVAIYGGSYGGYSALVGATFTPERFRCSVALVGPSNLITFINTIPDYWKPLLAMLKRRVGDPETESDFLKSRSPLFHVDNISIPMLVAHGANDPRVKQAESEQIVEAMREKGIDHEYMLFEDEGHGFAKPENRLKFYEAVDRFLGEHMGEGSA